MSSSSSIPPPTLADDAKEKVVARSAPTPKKRPAEASWERLGEPWKEIKTLAMMKFSDEEIESLRTLRRVMNKSMNGKARVFEGDLGRMTKHLTVFAHKAHGHGRHTLADYATMAQFGLEIFSALLAKADWGQDGDSSDDDDDDDA